MKLHHFKPWFLCSEIEYHNLINYYDSDIVFDIKKYVNWLENDIFPENRRKIRQTDIFHYFHIIPLDTLKDYFINFSNLFYQEYPFAKDGDAQKQEIVTYFLFKLESLVEEIQDSYLTHTSKNFYVYYRYFDISSKEFNYYIIGEDKDDTYILQYLERVKEIVTNESIFSIQNKNDKINKPSLLLTNNDNIKSFQWNNYENKKDVISSLYEHLKDNDKIDDSRHNFIKIFSLSKDYSSIKWKGNGKELVYLFFLLWNDNLVQKPKNNKTTFFNCFQIDNYKQSNFSVMLSSFKKNNNLPSNKNDYLDLVNKLKNKQFS